MKSLKIVIADNESVIRMDVREMLEEAGHEVVGEAVNGKKSCGIGSPLQARFVHS